MLFAYCDVVRKRNVAPDEAARNLIEDWLIDGKNEEMRNTKCL